MMELLDHNPEYGVVQLAMLWGVINALDRASAKSLGDQMGFGPLLLMCLIFGSLGGVLSLLIDGALLGWSGRLLGGRASSADVRCAVAWGKFPKLIYLVLLCILMGLLGPEMFQEQMPSLEASDTLSYIVLGIFALSLAGGVWTAVCFLKCLGEAHFFSAWKALGAVIIGYGVVILPIVAILMLMPGNGSAVRTYPA